MKSKVGFCVEDYNVFREDQNNYAFSWKQYNSSYKPVYRWERVYSAFQYRSANELNGYPVVGKYNIYGVGGGYVYEMRGQKSYLQGNLTLLQINNWIDRQTRAVIIEFSVFNPNINLIGVAEITVEFLPTGTIVKSSRFDPIILFTNLSLFQTICHILYMLFIIYYSIQEILQFFKQGKTYLLQFWTLVEWSIIGFSWAAFGLFFYRINAANDVALFFKQTSGYGYFKLQKIAFWNLALNYSLSFCIALGTLKFLKVFQFNDVLLQLGMTLKNCIKELFAFFFMFLTIWIGFVQLFHFIFLKTMLEFSTPVESMKTCFEIMLGNFEVDPLVQTDPVLGRIIYMFYNVFIVFIMLTVFISIINDSFKTVRNRSKKRDYKMSQYLFDKFYSLFSKKNAYEVKVNTCQKSDIIYKDQIEYLAEKVENLLTTLDEVKINI